MADPESWPSVTWTAPDGATWAGTWIARRDPAAVDGAWVVFDPDFDEVTTLDGVIALTPEVLGAVVQSYRLGLSRGRQAGDAAARHDIRRALFADLTPGASNEALDARLERLEEPAAALSHHELIHG